MSLWSVYNYDRRAYDYYEAPGPAGTHAGAPPRPIAMGDSTAPESATWRLPIGAKKIGMGEMPKGRIASTSSGLGLGDLSESMSLPIVIGVAYLAWRFLR